MEVHAKEERGSQYSKHLYSTHSSSSSSNNPSCLTQTLPSNCSTDIISTKNSSTHLSSLSFNSIPPDPHKSSQICSDKNKGFDVSELRHSLPSCQDKEILTGNFVRSY